MPRPCGRGSLLGRNVWPCLRRAGAGSPYAATGGRFGFAVKSAGGGRRRRGKRSGSSHSPGPLGVSCRGCSSRRASSAATTPCSCSRSLLTQHQFSEGNFAIGSLNRPDALNNYQSRLTVEQVLFDARQTSRGVEAARFTRQMAGEDTRRSHSDVVLNVLRTYFGVTLAEKNLEVARQSVESAQADLARAESIYQSGRSTQADVLALRVHLAAMHEQQIRASNDLAVARAALNDALGVSLDRAFELTTPLESSAAAPEASLEEYRRLAAENRPEMRQAELAQRLARTQQQIAGSAYWPQVVFQGIVEADRQNFFSKGGA